MVATPFLLLRFVYFCLAIFSVDSADARWNPLAGSMAALVCMAMIPEFVTLMIYVWVGFTADVSRHCGPAACCTANDSSKIGDDEQVV